MRAWIHDGYPSGSRQEFSNPISLAWKQPPSKLVLHTTEGPTYPSAATYDNGRRAPHVTVDPWARTWRQHYPLTEAAWALKAPGTVSTNTLGAVQVEIIGTCDGRNGRLPFVPGIAGADRAYLVGLLRYIAAAAGIPWQAPGLTWRPYPESYGVSASQRLSAAAWTAYRGLIGHQHVPGNSHGDPGAIPIDQWLAAGAGTATPEEDDMALTPEQDRKINAIFDAIFNGGTSMPEGKPLKDLISDGRAALATDLARVEAKVDAIGAAAGVNVDALAAEVASRLTITTEG